MKCCESCGSPQPEPIEEVVAYFERRIHLCKERYLSADPHTRGVCAHTFGVCEKKWKRWLDAVEALIRKARAADDGAR